MMYRTAGVRNHRKSGEGTDIDRRARSYASLQCFLYEQTLQPAVKQAILSLLF
jgi:hypothetical protein